MISPSNPSKSIKIPSFCSYKIHIKSIEIIKIPGFPGLFTVDICGSHVISTISEADTLLRVGTAPLYGLVPYLCEAFLCPGGPESNVRMGENPWIPWENPWENGKIWRKTGEMDENSPVIKCY